MEFLTENPALLAIAVFCARVTDVSMGTMRTILVFRGQRVIAAMIGFFEVLIWITAAGMVLRDLTAWHVAVAYAGGFATGNYVGIWLESKLAIGLELVRVISTDPAVAMAARLRAESFSVTEVSGRDDHGCPVEVLFVVDERRRLRRLVSTIEQVDPEAIYTTSDVKQHRSALAPRSNPLFTRRK